MVQYQPDPLDATFAALADPTRRAILARLMQGEASLGALAAPFAMSLTAVAKHVGVLGDAGLVHRKKTGRVVTCRIDAANMRAAAEWLARYERFWTERLDALEDYLAEDLKKESDPCTQPSNSTAPSTPPSPGSKSPAATRRRAKKSSAPGPIRRH